VKLSSFSVNTVFIVLMLWGICLIPHLSVKLYPSPNTNNICISYSWRDSNAELVESEITSKIEANISRIKGIKDIRSKTYYGGGYINLEIDKDNDIDVVRLEISSILRSIKNKLPKGMKLYPLREESNHSDNDEDALLLGYVITGPGTTLDVANYAKENISPIIRQTKGVKQVNITGYEPFEWVLEYDKKILKSLGLRSDDLYFAINNFYTHKDAGKVLVSKGTSNEYSYVLITGDGGLDKSEIKEIIVKKVGSRIIRLKDIVKISYKEKAARLYYRINGLNRININIYVESSVNRIDKAAELKSIIDGLSESMPDGYSLNMAQDSTEELKEKIGTIVFRTCLTILILLSFVLIISRNLKYLAIISISLLANILISFVFYYFLKVEINIYTMAGITVSLGIIIDNVIVMADHLRFHKDKKVFLAILAATLTTLGALWVVFGMGDSVMGNIKGFSMVILLNLSVSLAISLFFVPALMDKIDIRKKSDKSLMKARRRIILFNKYYFKVLCFVKRWKVIFILLAIFGFGTPIYMLPREVEGDKWYDDLYNNTIGSKFYGDIKPYVDKSLGGSLRLFTNNMSSESYRRNKDRRTQLYVSLYMDHGATMKQMNEAMKRYENFIASFDEIEKFTAYSRSANYARINILFKKEYEDTGFPKQLQNKLGDYANSIGNANTSISGLEKSFSNNTYNNNWRNSIIKLTGYNYRKIISYCETVKEKLEERSRVQKLVIGNDPHASTERGFQIKVDRFKLAKNNTDIGNMLYNLRQIASSYDLPTSAYINDKMCDLVIREKNKGRMSIWELNNMPLQTKTSVYKLSDVGTISEEGESKTIIRHNQEYEVSIAYDYVGSSKLAKRIRKREVKNLNKILPIGFKAEDDSEHRYFFSKDTGVKVVYILLAFVIIFFICSILLESLKQALAIIVLVPISFIGSFLAFYLFEVEFGEGGYASFILLCGLLVNSALYIINDYNNKIRCGRVLGISTYIRAFNSKIIPIFLTIASTILGFIPFLIGSDTSGFWFSIAVGTMSGLIFSVVVLLFYLPMFMPLKRK
jgi:multidrug efflux pump subunit AcrB